MRRHYSISCMVFAMAESVFGVLAILYFMYLSKSADGLINISIILSIISFFGVYFYPEPPRYLIKRQDYG